MSHLPPLRAGDPALPRSLALLYSALFVAIAFLGWGLLAGSDDLLDPDAAPRPVDGRGDLQAEERVTIQLFEQAAPSVVFLSNVVALPQGHVALEERLLEQGSGSGFVWDQDGHIVTNYHVVEGMEQGVSARVTLGDQTWEARLVGSDVDHDLAVLKIGAPPDDLRPIPIGRSADLRVGQTVYAIGNPFGLDQTLTRGIISGLGREILSQFTNRPIYSVIQTDAAINPGNSGGPLLDSAGRLIGVNTALLSTSGVHAGVGFAVPVDTVNRIVPQILRNGRPDRPGLGIFAWDDANNEKLMQRLRRRGVAIQRIQEGSGADLAGLRPCQVLRWESPPVLEGDIIVAVDGAPVMEFNDMLRELRKHDVGDTVRLSVVRHQRDHTTEETVSVTLRSLN